jgi:transposase
LSNREGLHLSSSFKENIHSVPYYRVKRKEVRSFEGFYLIVSLELEVADPTFESHKEVVGMDVGIRYLAVTSTSTGKPTFHSGKAVRERANHYARLRKRLQQKGTRNATRRLPNAAPESPCDLSMGMKGAFLFWGLG